MSERRYRVVVADCPWKFSDTLPGKGRGAAKHYTTMSVDDIKAYPLPALHDDCVLFLWRVASMQREALDVVDAWGFKQKSEIVWRKLTRTGKPHFGMGRTVRASHETCLIATRGRPIRLSASERSVFDAAVTVHSSKPDEFFRIVARLYEGPRISLFERAFRAGFDCAGDQLPGSEK